MSRSVGKSGITSTGAVGLTGAVRVGGSPGSVAVSGPGPDRTGNSGAASSNVGGLVNVMSPILVTGGAVIRPASGSNSTSGRTGFVGRV
ncbi:MAG: hypothetical protein BWZ07_03230 [Alphaproteobacteria bacterium ADurb.BinA280]|nr:MAG: hypothetical protein BWZ07_03230 [Alphaproteobacteria bacterium ADurb.BinA280]